MRVSPWKVFRFTPQLASWLSLLLAAVSLVQAEQLPIRIYTIADGLPDNRIQRIIQDSHGFLWFCTSEGLSRFDGYGFTNYGPEQGYNFGSDVNDLIETREGVYWVATNGRGLARFNPEPKPTAAVRFTYYPVGQTSASNHVNVLYQDRAGRIWLGTDGGLFQLKETPHGIEFSEVVLGIPAREERSVQVWAFAEDSADSLWIGTKFGLVRRLPDGRMIHYVVAPNLTDDVVPTLLCDREGRVWTGHTSFGLVVFQPEPVEQASSGDLRLRINRAVATAKSGHQPLRPMLLPAAPGEVRAYTAADGLGSSDVKVLCQTANGHLWIGSRSRGVTEFDGQRFRAFSRAHGLTDNRIVSMAEDRAGNLWMGTVNGAMRLALQGFVTYMQADGLGHDYILSVCETQPGELYVTSGEWRIQRFEGEHLTGPRFTSVRLNLPPSITDADWRSYRNIIRDHAGEWWVATKVGLFRFPKVERIEQLTTARPVVYTTRDGLLSNDVMNLYEDSRGDIWMSTFAPRNETLARWERATGQFHHYSDADGLPPFVGASGWGEDTAGTLWVGLGNSNLARYAAGRFTLLTEADGLPPGAFSQIYFDHAGRLWVGTPTGGLARSDDPQAARPRFVRVQFGEGLRGSDANAMMEDSAGYLYAGTSRGLARLEATTSQFKHYTTADGLGNFRITTMFRDHDGTLWVGTDKGLSRLIPQPERPSAPPPVMIGELSFGSRGHPLSALGETAVSGLVLEPDQNQVRINFFSLSFAAGETLRYQYKLEGTRDDWSAASFQREVNFASLAPGNYRFLVRAVAADGQTSPAPAIVAFRILAPVWQRWWFLALAVMLASLVGYALYRYRVAQLIALERVRTRIATDLHDDIGASLSRMAILSEVVKQQTGTLNLQTHQTLSEIADSARGLVDSMSDIVWSIDPRRDDLKNVVTRVRQFAADVLEAQGIAWEFIVPHDLERIKLTPEERRHLFLIFKEALNNIARHSRCSNAALSLSITHHRLLAEIRDDGRGLNGQPPGEPSSNGRGGNGLHNMKARAAELGGRLEIDTAPGQGTRLRLTIPWRK